MKNKIYLSLIFMVVVLIGCKSNDTIIPQQFNVVSPLSFTNPAPNFKTEQTKFTAKFDQIANWKITITGKVSGATKTFNGAGTAININWNGLADNLPLFGTEDCNVELSFPDFPAQPKQVQKLTTKGLVDIDKDGIIVTDFSVSKIRDWYAGEFATDTINWGSDFNLTSVRSSSPSSPDGTPYLFNRGFGTTDYQTKLPSPYVDQIAFRPSNSDKSFNLFWPLPEDANRVFFNVMVYSSASKDSSIHYKDATLQFTFTESNAIECTAVITPNWEGWKILSFNYSAFKFTNPSIGPRPDRIRKITAVVLTNAPFPYTSINTMVAFDHLIFTLDRPFNPFNN